MVHMEQLLPVGDRRQRHGVGLVPVKARACEPHLPSD